MDSLLSIISSQRERFRARNQELEAVSHACPSLLYSWHLGTLRGHRVWGGDTQVHNCIRHPLGQLHYVTHRFYTLCFLQNMESNCVALWGDFSGGWGFKPGHVRVTPAGAP